MSAIDRYLAVANGRFYSEVGLLRLESAYQTYRKRHELG